MRYNCESIIVRVIHIVKKLINNLIGEVNVRTKIENVIRAINSFLMKNYSDKLIVGKIFKIVMNIWSFIAAFIFSTIIGVTYGNIAAIVSFSILGGLIIYFFIAHTRVNYCNTCGFILVLLSDFYVTNLFYEPVQNLSGHNLAMFSTFFIAIIVVNSYVLLAFFSWVNEKILCKSGFSVKQYWRNVANLLAIFFILVVFIPAESYFSNIQDFDIKYSYFAVPCLLIWIFSGLILPFLLCNFSKKVNNIIISVESGVLMGIYAQYMFMNYLLMEINGSSIKWNDYRVDIILNAIVWGALIAIPLVLRHYSFNKWKKLVIVVPLLILGLHMFTWAVVLMNGLPNEKEDLCAQFSFEEQYVVSGEENVIVLVFDAVDNDFIDEIYNTDIEAFKGLEDFTLYTNTCSVYDGTATSVMTMMAGARFNPDISADEWYRNAWNEEKTVEFYDRMHSKNFRVNYYNFHTGNKLDCIGKIDNIDVDSTVKLSKIRYGKIADNFKQLSLYRTMPYWVKSQIDIEHITFDDLIVTEYNVNKKYYNEEYMGSLELSISEEKKPYLIYQHLSGAHEPCDSFIDETKYCLSILKKYIDELKTLDVYDQSTVIVMSDHGKHSYMTEAATPMFMIKEKNTTHSEMVINSAPIYHEDLIATILENEGLYDESSTRDNDIFGTSIYMHYEGEERERIWYDRARDESFEDSQQSKYLEIKSSHNAYWEYRYTGDKYDLKRKVKERDISAKYHIFDFFG